MREANHNWCPQCGRVMLLDKVEHKWFCSACDFWYELDESEYNIEQDFLTKNSLPPLPDKID